MNRPKKRGTAGFTLAEILVVLGIIVLLMGLMIPAVHSARASARKAKCQANQKQVGYAALQYETTNSKFPGFNHDLAGSQVGVVVMLSPYLEQRKIWDAWEAGNQTAVYLEVLVCPDDIPDNPSGSPNSYVTNRGVIKASGNDSVSIDWITDRDGTANTLLVSEKVGCTDAGRAWNKLAQSGDDVGFKDDGGMANDINSHHSDGAVVFFCDGHAQWLSTATGIGAGNGAGTVYKNLCDPDDGYLDPAKYHQ